MKKMKENRINEEMRDGERLLYLKKWGWMMWKWMDYGIE